MGFQARTTRAQRGRTAATLVEPPSARSSAGALTERPENQPSGLLVLGRYRLHRPLGAGGFGTVWMGRDERLERDVAVKVLARERIIGGRFEREARAAARLSHPGIVTLYEAVVDDDGAYLVSELVRGTTLAQLLEAGRLSDRDILEIGIALCDALDHAHGQGVVHRDVKPSNVLIPDRSAGPAAKLTDFGVARLIGADTLTHTGDVIGTAAYMAPEQADGREAGAPADLYSLALVLYEGLTGVNPIAHGTAAQRARRLGAHLPPLRRQRRELPGELGQALDLALRPRPRERGGIDELRGGLIDSLHRVEDEPGIVEPAWPRRSWTTEPAGHAEWVDDGAPPGMEELPSAGFRRPVRAVAGVAAGLSAAWLVTLVPGRASLVPAVGGLVAALLVAALPSTGWLLVIAGCGGWVAAAGSPGAALVIALAGLVPVLLLPRQSSRWPLAVLAPVLGAVHLAGLWPALAGRWPRAWERAGLGATGWLWTTIGGLLFGHALYSTPARPLPDGWSASLNRTGAHVLSRLVGPGQLAPAAVWALAAVLVPWLASRSLPLRIVLCGVWAAGLAAGTVAALHLGHGEFQVSAGTAVMGAVAAWIVLVAPAVVRWRATSSRSPDAAARLA